MKTFEKHRSRRIIYNDDGDQQFARCSVSYNYDIEDEQSFLDARTSRIQGTQVDTYVWCVGNGADPPYGDSKFSQGVSCAAQASDLVLGWCHQKGVEVWGSLRMNDIHDSRAKDLDHVHDPLKRAHPELLVAAEADRLLPTELAERAQWTVFNYARPKVQQHRIDFIQRNASAHDFDGYELDFSRHGFYFPLGEERDLAPKMTGFVRKVRKVLDEISQKRGRSYTLVTHVHDSILTSLNQGLDVETWLKEGLVDVLIVGVGYLPYLIPSSEWLSLSKKYGIAVYPAVNTNTYLPWLRETPRGMEAFPNAIRAHAAHYWDSGFEGQYLFNLFCMDEAGRNVPPEFTDQVLTQIGSSEGLAGTEKLYGIQGAQDSGFSARFGSDPAPLPIALVGQEFKLPLELGPDGGDSKAGIRITVLAKGDTNGRRVWLRLNNRLLDGPVISEGRIEVEVPGGYTRAGLNELAVWANENTAVTDRPIVINGVLAEVMYG